MWRECVWPIFMLFSFSGPCSSEGTLRRLECPGIGPATQQAASSAQRWEMKRSTPRPTATSPSHSPFRNWPRACDPRCAAPGTPPTPGFRIVVEDIELNAARRVVRKAGSVLRPTPKSSTCRTIWEPPRPAPRSFEAPASGVGRRIRPGTGVSPYLRPLVAAEIGARSVFSRVSADGTSFWVPISRIVFLRLLPHIETFYPVHPIFR